MTEKVTIIGGGLAGCEAAWQLAARGIPVRLYEMRPQQPTEAHQRMAANRNVGKIALQVR